MCCHCGTRAMLTLDAGHHTLICQSCGAPLSAMKTLPVPRAQPERAGVSHQAPAKVRKLPKARPAKSDRKPKKTKSIWRKIASEAFDLVEDIFD